MFTRYENLLSGQQRFDRYVDAVWSFEITSKSHHICEFHYSATERAHDSLQVATMVLNVDGRALDQLVLRR